VQSYYGCGGGPIGTYFFCVGNELLIIPPGLKEVYALNPDLLGGYFMMCLTGLTFVEAFLLSFPALAFFGTFLLADALPWPDAVTDDGGPPAGDRLISSSRYLLFASSAATLSRD